MGAGQISGVPLSVEVCQIIAQMLSSVQSSKRYPTHLSPFEEQLLHELILLIGYFTLEMPENQDQLSQTTVPGSSQIIPTLCGLPFQYFSDKRLCSILYVTLKF